MKKTFIEQIEVKHNGTIQVRFAKQRLNPDGTPDGDPQWHRAVFEVDTGIDAHMESINAHLLQMGEAPVGSDCVNRLAAHAEIARTPENVAACSAARAGEKAIAEARYREAMVLTERAEAARKAEFDAAVAAAVARQGALGVR